MNHFEKHYGIAYFLIGIVSSKRVCYHRVTCVRHGQCPKYKPNRDARFLPTVQLSTQVIDENVCGGFYH